MSSAVLLFMSLVMVAALAVSLLDGEAESARVLAFSMAVYAVTAVGLWKVGINPAPMSVKEGFATVGVVWIVASAFGALPYLLSGAFAHPVDAFFESVSGFTTTGATVFSNPGVLDSGLLFWRSSTQWLGGLGAILVAVAILPVLGVGGVQLQEVSATRAAPNFLSGRFLKGAFWVATIYAVFTVLAMALLAFTEMTPFQAVNHALTTVSTGGFSTEAHSIGSFGPRVQWVVLGLMVLAGISYSLHLRGLRRPTAYFRAAELRLYLLILGGASILVMAAATAAGSSVADLRHGVFTAVSLFTTTGHSTTNLSTWEPALQVLAFVLLFGGAMAGSATGGIKTFRIGILAKTAGDEIRRLVRPNGTFVMRFGPIKVGEDLVRSVQTFVLFYVLLFALGTLMLAFATAGDPGINLLEASSATASALGNVGPALGGLGPAASYASIPETGRVVLGILMLIGRVEIFPVLLLFSREFWRR